MLSMNECGLIHVMKPAMTILYIDDDPEDREIFEEAVKLVDPTTECLSAANGREAFALLGNLEKLPEHIVMDNNMPGMDGKSVLQELRKDPSFDNIHITLYSTNSLPRDIEEIESLVDNSLIQKEVGLSITSPCVVTRSV